VHTVAGSKLITGEIKGKNASPGMGCLLSTGYRLISHQKKQVLEHRVVMEKLLGRPLQPNETVHHGPRGRACNDPDNLSIRLKGNHPAGHSEQELANWLRSLGWKLIPPKRMQQQRKSC
jgi:hypothetical protein